MSLEEEKLNQNEWVRWLLTKNHNAELWKILSIWEKYKKEWEEMEQEFWGNRENYKFKNLLADYENKKEILIKYFELWLLPEERKMLSGLWEISREKFYKEYVYNVMLYEGNLNYEYDSLWNSLSCLFEDFESFISKHKNELKPWMDVSFLSKKIWDEWAKMLAKEWKNRLQPWMKIELSNNEIWSEWAKAIAEEWKDSLQPWMMIDLRSNNIWDEWIKAIAKEWKNGLKPWMSIDLSSNNIWPEWAKAIAEEWKDSLQPWMFIDFSNNNIWDEWIKAIAKERRNRLKPWIQIHCCEDDIWDEWIKILAEEWKDSLKQWMYIHLQNSYISDTWIGILVEEWKNSLKPWMDINLEANDITDAWLYEIMDLNTPNGCMLHLRDNYISEEKKDEISWQCRDFLEL